MLVTFLFTIGGNKEPRHFFFCLFFRSDLLGSRFAWLIHTFLANRSACNHRYCLALLNPHSSVVDQRLALGADLPLLAESRACKGADLPCLSRWRQYVHGLDQPGAYWFSSDIMEPVLGADLPCLFPLLSFRPFNTNLTISLF